MQTGSHREAGPHKGARRRRRGAQLRRNSDAPEVRTEMHRRRCRPCGCCRRVRRLDQSSPSDRISLGRGRQTVAAKSAQDAVRPMPVVRGIARRRRILRPPPGDLVPVDREANERHAEPLEGREALVERPGTELQPRVILDSEADAMRSPSGARADASRKSAHKREQPHTCPGHRRRTFSRRLVSTR